MSKNIIGLVIIGLSTACSGTVGGGGSAAPELSGYYLGDKEVAVLRATDSEACDVVKEQYSPVLIDDVEHSDGVHVLWIDGDRISACFDVADNLRCLQMGTISGRTATVSSQQIIASREEVYDQMRSEMTEGAGTMSIAEFEDTYGTRDEVGDGLEFSFNESIVFNLHRNPDGSLYSTNHIRDGVPIPADGQMIVATAATIGEVDVVIQRLRSCNYLESMGTPEE